MLDWFAGRVGYDASQIELGRNIILNSKGEFLRDSPTWESARSSHDTNIQVSSSLPTDAMLDHAEKLGLHCSQGPILRLSGNPVKYLQGHNVFGPSVSDLGPIIRHLVRNLPDNLRPFDSEIDQLPSVHRSVVDTNVSIDLTDHETVHRWIHNAEKSTRSKHGRAMGTGSTVYWGKNSKRWTLKAYCKHCELKVNKPNVDQEVYEQLLNYTKGILRMELRLKRLELADRGTLSEDIIWEFYDKITIGVMREDSLMEALNTMKRNEIRTLQLWMSGYDPHKSMSKNTYYTHRRSILKEHGIDIANPRADEEKKIDRSLFDKEYLKPRVLRAPPKELEPYLMKIS